MLTSTLPKVGPFANIIYQHQPEPPKQQKNTGVDETPIHNNEKAPSKNKSSSDMSICIDDAEQTTIGTSNQAGKTVIHACIACKFQCEQVNRTTDKQVIQGSQTSR